MVSFRAGGNWLRTFVKRLYHGKAFSRGTLETSGIHSLLSSVISSFWSQRLPSQKEHTRGQGERSRGEDQGTCSCLDCRKPNLSHPN